MFKIGKLFHLTHVVDDLAAVDKWYDDIFAVTRFYRGYEKLAGREASLLAIGEVIMEPMMPARVQELRNQSVKKFHDRFGQHFHSIAWYVDDVGDLSSKLDQHGLRLFNLVGSQIKPPNKAIAIWTHPKETHGQLEFALIGEFTIDPRLQPAWSNKYWLEQHPLGLERASHITVVVADLAVAKRLYCGILNGTLMFENETPRRRSAFIAVGEDSVVELAQPLSAGTPEARDLERNGEGIHALVFKTRNLQKAAEFLKSKGLRPAPAEDSITLDSEQAFGMTVGFTERALPNDPRA